MASEMLKVSRRKFRKIIVEGYGKPGEPSGQPWFGEGRFVQHLAVDINVMVGFCGRDINSISSRPIRTLIGITCPGCTRVLKKINRRIKAENKEATSTTEGQ